MGASDQEAFCRQLVALDRSPPPEPGGNKADEITELLAVADASVADDVQIIRDYHRDNYVEGDPSTDSYDSFPAEVREAAQRVDEYAAQQCEEYDP